MVNDYEKSKKSILVLALFFSGIFGLVLIGKTYIFHEQKQYVHEDELRRQSYKSNSMGLKIEYPSHDYVVNIIDSNQFLIINEHLQTKTQIQTLIDSSAMPEIENFYSQSQGGVLRERKNDKEKVINGIIFVQFRPENSEEYEYGYFARNKGKFYVFMSTNEPLDREFEMMMDTVRFK